MAYLQARGLTKHFGNTVAADDVELSIERGRVLCLLGPSGCGKTTTLRILAGLVQADQGSVWLEEEEITVLPTHRRQIGMVFQNWALFPHLSVFENIAFGLRVQRRPLDEIQRRVDQALEIVRLPGIGGRRPSQLSGGQQQRVALARTLVTNPRLMLFDEPLSNLDAKLRHEMRTELRRIQRELDLTAVYVTHDQGEALSIGDEVMVMRQGRVVEVGPPVKLFERPQTVYVADFLGVENILPLQDGAGGTYRTVGGLRVAASSSQTTVGSARAIGVRSENISVTRSPQSSVANQFRGVVTDLDFQGSRVLYVVQLEGTDTRLRALHSGTQRFEVGTSVVAGWHPDHALVLTD